MHQQRDADEAHDAGDAADDDRHPLLEGVRDAERVEHPDRRQQTDEMAEEDDENADMEQVRAPHQLPAAQQLARAAAPRVLLAVEAQPAAEQEHGEAEIGIPAEHDVDDQCRAWSFPYWRGGMARVAAGMSGRGAQPPRTWAISLSLQPSLAPGPNSTGSSSQAASSAARSIGVGIGQCEQRRDFLALRLGRRQRDQRAEHRFVSRLRACAAARPWRRGYAPAGRACRRPPRAAACERYSRNSGRKSGSSDALDFEAVFLVLRP